MSTTLFQHAYYIGSYMSGIVYGMELIAYCVTMRELSRKEEKQKSDRCFMIYSTALLILVTIDVSTNAIWGEQMWITYRNRPGGVEYFLKTQVTVWYETLSSTSVVSLVFVSDALLIYRCFVLWSSSYGIIILPSLIYLGAFALAVCQLISSGVPGGDFFAGKAVNFGVPYYAMSIGLNILLTGLVCGRLVYLSRSVMNAMGSAGTENARLYTGLMTIMVESAAPYSLLGILYLVPYALGSEIAIAFGQVWAKMTCLAPQLIVLRIVTRRALDRKTIDIAAYSIHFTEATGPNVHENPNSIPESSHLLVTRDANVVPASSEDDATLRNPHTMEDASKMV